MHALAVVRATVRRCVVALAVVAMVGIGAMMLTITYDVFVRFAFAAPTDWAYPLNALGVLSVTMLTVPYLYVDQQHIAMDLLHRSLPPRPRMVADVVTAVATGLFGVVVAVFAWRSMLVAIDTGLTGAGTFNIPFWVHDAVLVVAGVFLVLVAALFPPSAARGEPEASTEEPVAQRPKESEAV